MTAAVRYLLQHRRPFVGLVHLSLVALAYFLAFLLRFDFVIPPREIWRFLETLPLLVAIRMIGFQIAGLQSGLWRYASVKDVVTIVKAATATSLIFVAAVLALFGYGYPRSVYVLDWVLVIALTAGVRLAVRMIREVSPRFRDRSPTRIVVVGAGDAGEALLRDLDTRLVADYQVVALVDDDPGKYRRRVRGVEVMGSIDELPRVCAATRADEIVIAISSAPSDQLRRIVRICQTTGLQFRRIPRLADVLSGAEKISQLREVRPEELLDRPVLRTDPGDLRVHTAGRRVLVTGAAGSIGSELARLVGSLAASRLVLVDRNESGLYLLSLELRERHPGLALVTAIGDIQHERRMQEIFNANRPQVVYHAAAYKHVPLMEDHPLEAIENNILGTEILTRLAEANGVERFVLISTDKAVHPVSVMGMTKRVAERIVLSKVLGPATFLAVRFGNVLGSDGSVLPLFKWQAASWGRLAVTDPDALRYYMLPSEAAQLVLEAARLGDSGDIFFLNMGDQVRVMELARRFLAKAGLKPDLDVDVTVTGLRPGERVREALVGDGEELAPTGHTHIFRLRDTTFDRVRFLADLDELRQLVIRRDQVAALAKLKAMAENA